MPEDFPFQIEPLGKQDRSAFSCGNPELDRYIRNQASQDVKKRAAVCFVLKDLLLDRVAGFYSLAATSILARDFPAELLRHLPKYPQIPAILLGRLAVDGSYKGRGLGAYLLMDALLRCLTTAEDIGAVAVIVDAKDEAAAQFYRRHEFVPLADQPSRLFLPMKTIARLFEA